jgi:pimeloyl-ACP methyl ester carboxylesterase
MMSQKALHTKQAAGAFAVLVVGFALVSAADNLRDDVVGIWLGSIPVNENTKLRVAFEITKGQSGDLRATFASVDQNAFGIAVKSVTYENGKLILDVAAIGGVYEGNRIDATTITGKLKQGDREPVPLELKKVDAMPGTGLRRPQEPKKPYPYKEEEVTYENEQDAVRLAGTLTIPDSEGPFPAAVLITGSGPNERDERIWNHRVFLVLADYLTRQGIAVLRSDDRGVGSSTGDFASASNADFAADARAGLHYLQERSAIDPKRIGFIGHSLGGDIAALAASESPDTAFLVMMAGSASTLAEDMHYQCREIFRRQGASDVAIALNEKINRSVFSIIEQEKDNMVAERKIRAVIETLSAEVAKMADKDRGIVGLPSPLTFDGFAGFLTTNGRHDLFFSAASALEGVRCPTLAIIGSKDLQVSPKANLKAIAEALERGGNRRITIKELPGLNHLFQTADSGVPSEYPQIEETISPTALDVISTWILQSTASNHGEN